MKYKLSSGIMLLSIITVILYQNPTMASMAKDAKIKSTNTSAQKQDFSENISKKSQDSEIKVLQMKSENGGNNIVINVITKGKETSPDGKGSDSNVDKIMQHKKKPIKENKKPTISNRRRTNIKKNNDNIKEKANTIKTEPIKQEKIDEVIKNDDPETDEIEYIVKEEYVDENGNITESKTRPATNQEANEEEAKNKKLEGQKLSINKPSFQKE